ncbi:MAG: hypothetical protein KDN19_10020 [Verrucomicrobiae bacterium]|nr:hypothetical protein [Verrucomicrobiae bacterium]
MKRSFLRGQPMVALVAFCLLCVLATAAEAQLRPIPVRKSKADRKESSLIREDGAVYLEGLVNKEVKARVTAPAPIYTTLTADRWLGNLFADQEVTVLAISEKAYRVRGRAKQGQVAGWVGKAMVEGLSEEFEGNLTKLHERQLLVDDLIENEQVALGMTQEEVTESLGEPSKQAAKIDQSGHTATFEYITYDRIPQQTTARDAFGRLVQTVTYVEVETGKVTIEFEKGVVKSIAESEGVDRQSGVVRVVPPPILLF